MRLPKIFPSAIALVMTVALLAFALAPPIMARAANQEKAFAAHLLPDISPARHVVVDAATAARAAPSNLALTLDLAANGLVRLHLKSAPTNAPESVPKLLLLANRSTGDIHTPCAATNYPLLE